MFKRPTSDDTEEDLLRLQEEFQKQKTQPSAKVVHIGDKRKHHEGIHVGQHTAGKTSRDVVQMQELPAEFGHTTAAPTTKKSKFKKQQEGKSKQAQHATLDPEEAMEEGDVHITKVLTDIVERDFGNVPVANPCGLLSGGFPTVLHRGDIKQSTEDGSGDKQQKKKSLFAQQFAQSSPKDFGISTTHKKSIYPQPLPTIQPLASKVMERQAGGSCVITGQGLQAASSGTEAHMIHEENVAKIATMSVAEVKSEQAMLLEMLDPGIVDFLKKRKQKQALLDIAEAKDVPMRTTEHPMETESASASIDVKDIKACKDLVSNTDVPGQPTKTKEWVHMDRVEADKLEWTKDLPAPPTPGNKQTGQTARFDLQGKLMAADVDVPVHIGLHHHGDEPERAGYALSELFQLARSLNMQQRAMALTTLANIMKNARLGEFDECASVAITPALVDGGIVYILRWALDDATESTLAAAVHALYCLLVCQPDEVCADHVFAWEHGAEAPCLQPLVPQDSEDDTETSQQTHQELLKSDMIQGLLKMSLLPRLRYVLEVWRPSAGVVAEVLSVLLRVARHSPQSAYSVAQCPRLLSTIFKEFLPLAWTAVLPYDASSPMTSIYGYPVSRALKLIRVICTASKHMAANLMASNKLMDVIIRYVSEIPANLQLHSEEASSVYVEALRTWRVLLAYGLATQHFREYYVLLVKSLSTLLAEAPSVHSVEVTTLLCLFETVTHSAAFCTLERPTASRVRFAEPPGEMEHKETTAIPEVNWSHVVGLSEPIESLLLSSLEGFTIHYFENPYDLSVAASCLHYVATWMQHLDSMPGYNAVDTIDYIERLVSTVLLPTLRSTAFGKLWRLLREKSVLLWPSSTLRQEVSATLPELGSLLGGKAQQCPLTGDHCPINFLSGIVRLLTAFTSLHKGLITQQPELYSRILQDDDCVAYVRRVCQSPGSNVAHSFFTRHEHWLLYHLLLLKSQSPVGDHAVFHQAALSLVIRVHPADTYIAHSLFSSILFNRDFIRDAENDEDIAAIKDALNIQEMVTLSTATRQKIVISTGELVQNTLENLKHCRSTYLAATKEIWTTLCKDRARVCGDCIRTDSLQAGLCGQQVLPLDWVYLPLVSLYNLASNPSVGDTVDASAGQAWIVTHVLCWAHMLETYRPHYLTDVSPALKLSRLMCTFLAGPDLFLDSNVHSYLAALLKLYCKPSALERMDFEKPVPGLASFYDLYTALLSQYEAVSFGDSLFALYVLLPLQQCHSVLLRRALWGEYVTVLRSLNIPIREMWIGVERFVTPDEENVELLRLYVQAILAGHVTPQWSPLPYLIAVHHVNRFIYTHGRHMKLRAAFTQQFANSSNQELKHHILYYKQVSKHSELGMEIYEDLPTIRQNTLKKATTMHIGTQ